MRLRRPLPAVQGDTLHIVGVGDNRIGKGLTCGRVFIIYLWAELECGWHYCDITNTPTQKSEELTRDGYS